jgi:hypothetical protein
LTVLIILPRNGFRAFVKNKYSFFCVLFTFHAPLCFPMSHF